MKETSPMTGNQQSEAAPGGTVELHTGRPSAAASAEKGSLHTALVEAGLVRERPTCAGPIPLAFARVFQLPEGKTLPEFCKLPRPRERCAYTGASRTWLIEHGEAGHFKLARIRKAGSVRGAIFIHLPSLLAFIRGEMEKQTTRKEVGHAGN
jgi:hypothetical protein